MLSSGSVAGFLVWLGFSVPKKKNNGICYIFHRGFYEGKITILIEVMNIKIIINVKLFFKIKLNFS